MRKYAIILSMIVIFTFFNCIKSANATSTIDIFPTDDAYVVVNYDDPSDTQGLQHTNTGHLPFLKMWYAWNVTNAGKERIASIIYLKFNLTKINVPIESASLILHPFVANLTAPSRPADMYATLNNNWNESSIVFIGAPAFSTTQNSTAFISPKYNETISWDATRQVRDHEGSFLTVALVIRNMYIHNEELVDFYSKEAKDPLVKPSLVLVVSEPVQVQTSSNSINFAHDSTYSYVAIALLCAIITALVLKRKSKKHDIPTENLVSYKSTVQTPDMNDT